MFFCYFPTAVWWRDDASSILVMYFANWIFSSLLDYFITLWLVLLMNTIIVFPGFVNWLLLIGWIEILV